MFESGTPGADELGFIRRPRPTPDQLEERGAAANAEHATKAQPASAEPALDFPFDEEPLTTPNDTTPTPTIEVPYQATEPAPAKPAEIRYTANPKADKEQNPKLKPEWTSDLTDTTAKSGGSEPVFVKAPENPSDRFSFIEEDAVIIDEHPVNPDDTANHPVVVEHAAAADTEPAAQAEQRTTIDQIHGTPAQAALDADGQAVLPTASETNEQDQRVRNAKAARRPFTERVGRFVGKIFPVIGRVVGPPKPTPSPEQKAQQQAAQEATNNAKWQSRRDEKSLGGLLWRLTKRYQDYTEENQKKFNPDYKPREDK